MKRNMDLIRSMVLAIRSNEGRPSASEVQELIGDDDNGIYAYHVVLLTQSEMVTGVETGPRKDRYGIASLALTWAGHNFADNIISDAVWASVRKMLDDAELESASFEIWSKMAAAKITELCSHT